MALPARRGPGHDGRSPSRRCLLSGLVQPTAQLIRFVVEPAGAVMPDVAERLPGRGFWLSADRDVIDRACARKVFARAARAPVTIPATLTDDVERLLVRRCQDLIGLARRAKRVVFGYEQTRQWLERGDVAVLLAASDGSSGQRGKMRGVSSSVVVVDVLSAAELGHACGRERVVHGAVVAGALADDLVRNARRLEGFRKPSQSRDWGQTRAGFMATK